MVARRLAPLYSANGFQITFAQYLLHFYYDTTVVLASSIPVNTIKNKYIFGYIDPILQIIYIKTIICSLMQIQFYIILKIIVIVIINKIKRITIIIIMTMMRLTKK